MTDRQKKTNEVNRIWREKVEKYKITKKMKELESEMEVLNKLIKERERQRKNL